MLRPEQIPNESIQLNEYTFIINARNYYQSNLEVWQSNHGKPKFKPYLLRCLELESYLRDNNMIINDL
jgi:hypothetical protein